jgi:hypothetical protein
MSIFIDTFPVLVAFGDLHLIENLESAKDALNGQSGNYLRPGFVHIETGTSYIGSSLDLGGRIMNHILGHSSNLHQRNS